MAPSRLAINALVGATALLLAAPAFPAVVWLVLAADAMLAAAVFIDGGILRRHARLNVSRTLPPRFERGRAATYAIEIENHSPFALFVEGAEGAAADVRIHNNCFHLEIDAGQRETVTLSVEPSQRGERPVGPLRLKVWRRGGFAQLGAGAGVDVILVDPSFGPARRAQLALRTARIAAAGIHRLRLLGPGRDFDRLRDYVAGDDVRSIDWRATARRRFPVTKLFRAEREQNVVLAVDTGRLMGRREGESTRLDAAVEAALALSFAAQKNGDRVGLLLFDDEARLYLPPRRGSAHSRRIAEALARVQARRAAADPRALVDALRARCRSRALVVTVTDALDEEEGRRLVAALPSLTPPHLALAVFFREEALELLARAAADSARDALQALSARVLLEERRKTVAGLRQRGVRCVEARRSDLAASIVAEYLDIKSRQAL